MEQKRLSFKNIFANLFVYGTAHAIVDLICAGVVFTIIRNQIVDPLKFFDLIILYNILAFGLQIIFGFITDYIESPRLVTVFGCFLTGIFATTFLHFPIASVVFIGIGNALFHIGGGSVSLNLTPKKVTAPGIFVAPGALGLFIGIMLGRSGQFVAWPFILVLFILCVLVFVIKKPEMDYNQKEIKKTELNYFWLILLLVFLSIAIRSFVGMALVFPWKANIDLAIILTLAIVLGKGLGGVLADRFGWVKIAVGALILSIPFLVFGAHIPLLAIIGMFLFNITMPITLVAISNILPGRPGFAFGITCLALILGALPAFNSLKQLLSGQLFIFLIIAISAVSLFYALKSYNRNYLKENMVEE